MRVMGMCGVMGLEECWLSMCWASLVRPNRVFWGGCVLPMLPSKGFVHP